MQTKRSLSAVAAAGLALLPLPALAQGDFDVEPAKAAPPVYHNEVTVGGSYQSAGSYYFGRYTGRVHPGWYGLGGFVIQGNDWDKGGTGYWDFEGTDLGLDSRSLEGRFGQQGSWGVRLFYDGIPYYDIDGFRSVWAKGNGALVPGVAPGSITNATRVNPNVLGNYGIDTQRNIYGGEVKGVFGPFTVTSGFKRDEKRGWRQNSLTFTTGSPISPGLSTAAISTGALAYFAEPVSYDIDRYDINLNYDGGGRMQALLGYSYLSFTDTNPYFGAVNPFRLTGFGANAANVRAAYSLPPSNSAHQVRAQLGYNLTPTTRLNANFQYGLMQQNATFAPMTLNSNLASVVLPGSNADALMQTVYANVAVTAAPLPRLDLRLAYTLDDRENQTPRNAYTAYIADSPTLDTAFNIPVSYRRNSLSAEAGYRVLNRTRLSVTYNFDDTHRTYADTSHVTENTVQAKLRSTIMTGITGSLSYLYSYRNAANYNVNAPAIYISNDPTTISEFAGFQRYYLASRERNEIKASFDLTPWQSVDTTQASPWDGLSLSLITKYREDTYPNSQLGLRSNHSFAAGPDIGWQVTKGVALHAFYTYQRMFFDQKSVYWAPGLCNGDGVTLNATCNGAWQNKTTDDSHTAGITLDWTPTEALKFGVDYEFAYGNTGYTLVDGGIFALAGSPQTALAISTLPDVTSMLNSVTLRGEWKFRPNISVLGGYTFQRFTYKDPTWNATATQFNDALFPGTLKPNYAIHLIGAALRLRW